jgi:TolB-like protein/DNA-binding winged helix-turn-helix (wHTH) protein/Flp pilus assembly protein TadD
MGQYGGTLSGPSPGVSLAQELQFGDYTLDQSRYRLQKGDRLLRLEKRPMELLILLAERRGELVSREEIADRLWGKDVYLDVDHSINTAVRKVRLALRDDPDKPRFIETVVGKGYRFAAPVIGANGDSSPQVLPPPSVAEPPSASQAISSAGRSGFTPRRMLLVGAASLALFIVALVGMRGRDTLRSKQPAIKSIAVLPLKNLSGDPTQEYLADGMTEALIGRLSGIHDLRVISRTSVMQFKDTKLSVPEIAKSLSVDALVEGSVMREGDRIRVHAQLIRAATDEHFWSEEYDRELKDVLGLQSDVAQSIANKVAATLTGEERTRLVATRQVSPEVYESFLKGMYAPHNTKADIEKRIAYFQQAIRKDPTFAPAYVGLADASDNLALVFIGASPVEMRPKVIAAARKALELDPGLAEAHVVLADLYQKTWRWSEAEAEYKRALELEPNNFSAHHGYASWLLCQGRTDEALSWARRARELDPLGGSGVSIGWILYHARRYPEAIQELRSVVGVQPDDAMAHWFLGFVLIDARQPEQAIPELEKAASLSDHSSAVLGVLIRAYAAAGRRNDAFRLLAELKKREQAGYVPSGAFINAYLGLGDYDQAFVWFERAYQEQSNIMQFLKVHPFFDPVRNDPRFVDLVRRVGLN